ncbi:MAG: IclR family transcriptional regulator [Methylobacteriaceae bacterium]|jgi:DNA-binding IclR family transcriptional regulator|nr:IclR family transcriptional regulator [Methylobacteriaceae bacterium]
MASDNRKHMGESKSPPPAASGAQTLLRGLTIIELVAAGVCDVKGLVREIGAPRSTIHRILSNLVNQGYLHTVPYHGYTLGHKLISLGVRAREQRPLIPLARPVIEELATSTGDTVHLGVRDGMEVLYLDKVSGGKGLEMRSRVGQKMPLASTGLGKALLLGMEPEEWKVRYDYALHMRETTRSDYPRLASWPVYRETMLGYRKRDWVMDLEENEIGIRCVGAPVRDSNGDIIAAISIASVMFYMSEQRMLELGPIIHDAARRISDVFGASQKLVTSGKNGTQPLRQDAANGRNSKIKRGEL